MYDKESDNFPSLINSMVSIENAENVVKEPKRPMIRKYLKNISEISLLFKQLTNNPIKKDPSILTISVPIGKKAIYSLQIIDTKNLNKAPIAPPTATYIK